VSHLSLWTHIPRWIGREMEGSSHDPFYGMSNFLLQWSCQKNRSCYICNFYIYAMHSVMVILYYLSVECKPMVCTRMWLSWNSPSVFPSPYWILFFFHFSDYPLQLFSPVIAISNALFNRTIRPRAIERSNARRWSF
jgi:hypothetical protein